MLFMKLSVVYDFLPKERTLRTAQVIDHFGISFEQGESVIAKEIDLPIEAGDVVCFIGESGSGKTSIMRGVARALDEVVNLDQIELREEPLIDHLGLPFEEGVKLLTVCGLGEARLMLRTPGELSDGERYRFRLALGLTRDERWLLMDEFTATLDRTLAKVVAYNLQKSARQMGKGILVATTHEDVVEDLSSDVLVRCRLDGEKSIQRNKGDKKKESVWREGCGSAPDRKKTGPIFPGGITGITKSDSSDMSLCSGMEIEQ